MNSVEFRQWRDSLKLSMADAADALSIPVAELIPLEHLRTADGIPSRIPNAVADACSVLTRQMQAKQR